MDQDKIKEIVIAELKKKTSLSDIQNLLDSEHGIKITFMELRILASELEEVIAEMAQEEAAAEAIDAEAEEDIAADEVEPGSGTTVVEVSKLARPGAMMHGTVQFASGASAEWVLDQFGRLGLEKSEGQPTEDDIKEFQAELQKTLGSM